MLEGLFQYALNIWRFPHKEIQLDQTYANQRSFGFIYKYDIFVYYLVNFVKLLRNKSFGRNVVHVPIIV